MIKLTESDYKEAAELLNCKVAAIKAVVAVESSGKGFNSDGSPIILFEGHWFYKLTKGKYGVTMFSYPKWIRKYYNMNQHNRLQAAVQKDRDAALKSASWGLFQIMGFNYKKCGFDTIQEFINAMYNSEGEHLKAFCNFIISKGLDDELREQRWSEFAYNYNGSGYKKNKYDTKLDTAFKKYSRTV